MEVAEVELQVLHWLNDVTITCDHDVHCSAIQRITRYDVDPESNRLLVDTAPTEFDQDYSRFVPVAMFYRDTERILKCSALSRAQIRADVDHTRFHCFNPECNNTLWLCDFVCHVCHHEVVYIDCYIKEPKYGDVTLVFDCGRSSKEDHFRMNGSFYLGM